MKLVVNEDPNRTEDEIIINCRKIDGRLLNILDHLKVQDEKITVYKNGSIFIVELNHILYFESVDKKTFVYTKNQVYEAPLRLYEIEDKFSFGDFFRASKSTIINLSKIKRINPMFGGKVEVLLDNDEKLLVSRQYVKILKEKLNY